MVLATEAFAKLAKVTLDARRLPGTLAIVIRGNPEFLDEPALAQVADRVLDEAVRRLTTGAGSIESLIG
ncbi:MAG: hypothetical protein HY322_09285 [Betaproteobacteria bacterium]|nr:hypothetical protein [Betaproteobacteria bacterium]